jgi:hypothetical protein
MTQEQLEELQVQAARLLNESLEIQRMISTCIEDQRRIAHKYCQEVPFELVDDFHPDEDLYAQILQASERGQL